MPFGADEYDRIIIDPQILENVRVYITETETYTSSEVKEQKLKQGQKLAINYPNVAYITVVSTSSLNPGAFRIGYSYEARVASDTENQPTNSASRKEPDSDPQVDSIDYNSASFFLLVVIITVLISLLLMLAGICCFYKYQMGKK